MAQPTRVEDPAAIRFITSRTVNSKLWFVGDPKLQRRILGYLAKYQNKYGVEIFGFILMGNHYHLLARFPNMNCSRFMQAFNSRIAWLVGSSIQEIENRKVWHRRYSTEELPRNEDVEHWAFYLWLNPVSSGLVKWIGDYRSYNSFSACAYSLQKEYEVVDWTRFNNHRRSNPNVSIAKYITKYKLIYSRLPGYEDLTPAEYRTMLLQKLEKKRLQLVSDRIDKGDDFPPKNKINYPTLGSKPKKSKSGSRSTHRPLVLTLCAETRSSWYERRRALLSAYIVASKKYLAGSLNEIFPQMTYRPPRILPTLASELT